MDRDYFVLGKFYKSFEGVVLKCVQNAADIPDNRISFQYPLNTSDGSEGKRIISMPLGDAVTWYKKTDEKWPEPSKE